jgi:hypothetical protein
VLTPWSANARRKQSYRLLTGSVEIVRDDVLFRVHFPIPEICGFLTEAVMDNVINELKKYTCICAQM